MMNTKFQSVRFAAIWQWTRQYLFKQLIFKQFRDIALLTLFLLSMGASVQAESRTHQMILSHHDFEAWTFKPQAQDQIVITNHSDIAHSIYVTYPDGTVVNLGVQLPGETVNWTIPAAGEYLLQCWIHPIIRATLTVEPSHDDQASDVQEVDDG